MAEALVFAVLAACILGFGILVVTSRDTVHGVLFLVLDFLCVAALYVVLEAPFVAAIQVLVYAGGIVVLYLFVVMLVNLKRPAEAFRAPERRTGLGVALAIGILAEIVGIVVWSGLPAASATGAPAVSPLSGNTEQVGWLLYTRYLVPFEVASMLLLVAMIGAIVLAKRDR